MNKQIEEVNITQITIGDTVIHEGKAMTVGKENIKYDSFTGRTLFGDSYRLGTVLVKRVIFK